MNSLSREDALRLADRCLALTQADQAEVLVFSTASYLTRFADNRIHQNVGEEDLQVSVRAVLGKRVGVAGTNRMDDEGIGECCANAAIAAQNAVEDPDFPGLPAPRPLETPDRVRDSTLGFDAGLRADAARELIDQSRMQGLAAAGKVEASASTVAIVNSLGVRAAMPVTDVRASVLAMGETGSGWADFAGCDADALLAGRLGEEAASLAVRAADPGALDPGSYTVVLAPDAVATMLDFLSYTGFSAKAVAEGSSFMAGRLGEKVLSERITIRDDALADDALGLTFDYEGMPKHRADIVREGVLVAPVTDSYWAARTGADNTGCALPAPNTFGPLPLNLRLEPGDASEAEMIASVERGLYVTRFHYVNIEDPTRAVLTGMTRDGTFLIEGGKLTRPVKNLRFTQSAVEALAGVLAVGRDRRYAGDEGSPPLVPALLLESFDFTGQTR
ncbi:MAG TPA: TldD/PmbA family protein [Coriobacteriia bacterium]|jgi:predicted Zn-dependent protease